MTLPPPSQIKSRRLAGPLLAVLLALPLVYGCGERMTAEEAALPIEGVEPVESRGRRLAGPAARGRCGRL